MAQIIAGLGAQLGLDTTEFKKGISEAKKSLKELAEYLPEALSVAAFVEMTHAAMEFSNKIVETAKANDVATASVLELSKALEENGGHADETSRVYSGFTAKLESAIQGNAKAQDSFARLGITLNDLRHLSEQDLFEKTINSLGNMKDAAERNGLAFQTLGKSIKGVDLTGLAKTMEENKGTMDKYAGAVEQAHELSLKLDATSKNLTLNFTNAFIPTLNALYDIFTKNTGMMEKFFNFLKTGAQIIGDFVSASLTALEHFWSITKLLAKDLYALFDYRSYTQGTFFKQLTDNLNDFTAEWSKDSDTYVASLQKIDEANKRVGTKSPSGDAGRTVINSYAKQLLMAEQLSATYEDQSRLAYEELKQKMAGTEQTKKEKEVQDAVNKVLNERDKVIDSINKKIAETDPTARGGAELIATYKKQQDQIMLTAKMQEKMTKEFVQDTQIAQEKFGFGWTQAFNQYQENAMTAADAGRNSFNLVMNSMTSALENFSKTGKLNFADLVRNIVLGLIQIQIQMQAMKAASAFSNFFGLGSLFGGSSGPAPVETAVPTLVGTKSAGGGDLSAGQASVVGENGPEIIVPRGASTVIPNHMTGSMGGTNQTINNYNIQAIDTKSFEDRIYGSSGAVWAANQYATKNIATTRSRT